jgi:serine/threonine protein kinase
LIGVPPLSWTQRVQISLDAARGLEYIHEHTKPTYIHRDIKSANILIDSNFRAKVGPIPPSLGYYHPNPLVFHVAKVSQFKSICLVSSLCRWQTLVWQS